jgi:hypothetical protein
MSSETLISALYVFALAAFLGYQVISRVPPLLHTPLMSVTNAISGIILVGAMLAAGPAETEHSCISLIQHFGGQVDLHGLAFPRARNEHPVRSRSDGKGIQSLSVQGCDEAIGISPDADSLHENVPIRGQAGVKVGAKNAIVFGMDPSQIDAYPGHSSNPVREKHHRRFG